ncbi:outer membrane lipoprotein-sorting protein [Bacteroides heparinolyticus]|uniref:outer membrane lipoprotein-sorting protein n=3 Tax=Prevotella heparinolytica TaxID=28113 RepID=UPI0035A1B30A
MKAKILFFLCVCNVFLLPAASQELSATAIVEKAGRNREGQVFHSEIKMTIIRPKWKREIGAKMWVKTRDYSCVLLTSPARERGQAFLKRKNDLWNWQPGIERTVKMSASMTGQSWLGSDFTTDDIVRQTSFINDFTHTLLGKEMFDGNECYKILLTPKPESVIVWGKVISWISTKDFVDLQNEYYDEDSNLVQTYRGYDFKRCASYYVPMRMEIVPAHKNNHKTILTVQTYQLTPALSDSFFSLQNIKNIH